MPKWLTRDLYPGVLSCDLLSRTPGFPSITLITKSCAEEEELIPREADNWLDLEIDVMQLNKLVVTETLAAHFKLPLSEIIIEGP